MTTGLARCTPWFGRLGFSAQVQVRAWLRAWTPRRVQVRNGQAVARRFAGWGCGESLGRWRERLSLAFAEHFLECFEHGHLINWLRNVRRAV
jgi:hypothetical protein